MRLTVGMFPVTVEDLLCLGQKRNITHVLGLLTSLADPDLAVNVRHQMLRLELLHVRKSQTRQATETKNVADLRQPGDGNLLVEHGFQLLLFEEFPFDRIQMKPNLGKRILFHPPIG